MHKRIWCAALESLANEGNVAPACLGLLPGCVCRRSRQFLCSSSVQCGVKPWHGKAYVYYSICGDHFTVLTAVKEPACSKEAYLRNVGFKGDLAAKARLDLRGCRRSYIQSA